MSKYIKSRVSISTYEIDFSYKTKKGNTKTQQVSVQQVSEDLAKRDFWIWIDTMRDDKPDYAMIDAEVNKITLMYTTTLNLDKKV